MQMIGLSFEWEFSELFGFDDETIAMVPEPRIAVIVNYERLNKDDDVALGSADNLEHVKFYMKQTDTLENACGIIACIHAILNANITLGVDSMLQKLKDACGETPQSRAKALEDNEEIN